MFVISVKNGKEENSRIFGGRACGGHRRHRRDKTGRQTLAAKNTASPRLPMRNELLSFSNLAGRLNRSQLPTAKLQFPKNLMTSTQNTTTFSRSRDWT
jgi:hypothetical protein